MKIEQKKISNAKGWETLKNNSYDAASCNLVLAFGSTSIFEEAGTYKNIREYYPNAHIVMSSAAGEIYDTGVNDDIISLTAICFEKTKIKTAVVQINEMENSREAGNALAVALEPENLKNVLVISDGLKVNGDELIQGLQECLLEETIITGGLAGDGSAFKKTLVGLNEPPIEGRIVVIGFYGEISPLFNSLKTELHNQTMTITTFSENE